MKKTDQEVIKACEQALSMASAAAILGIHFNTLKSRAQKLGVYKTNPSGKGLKKVKKDGRGKIPLQEILDGCHPQYQTNKLRIRLVKSKTLLEKCEICGIVDWNGKPVSLELDHIDGDRTNHRLSNLRIICPNCHSQTSTYRARNKK